MGSTISVKSSEKVVDETEKPEIPVGYPAIAHVMAAPGLTMFKRFAPLNTRSLLYMQAEILILESRLKDVVELDYEDDDTKDYARSCEKMMDEGGEQWEQLLKLRDVLEKYNTALIQQAEISKISPVRPYDHSILESFVDSKKDKPSKKNGSSHSGNSQDTRVHIEAGTENAPFLGDARNLKDMVNVQPRPELDSFTRILAERLLPWLADHWKWLARRKKLYNGDEEAGLREWDDKHFTNIVRVMAVLISTLFPSIAVLVLYFIPKLPIRLGAVLLFSMLFSGVLAAFTRARPIEIFAATAACASVQVVFVGSTSTIK